MNKTRDNKVAGAESRVEQVRGCLGYKDVEAARGECSWGNLGGRFSSNSNRMWGHEKFTCF